MYVKFELNLIKCIDDAIHELYHEPAMLCRAKIGYPGR